MQIEQFRYGADNLGYVLYTGKKAIAVDGGAVQRILDFLEKNDLTLEVVTNTHNHPDHTVGSADLAKISNASLLSSSQAAKQKQIPLGDEAIKVLATPGHTTDSICFYTPGILVSGDTLFNATVGNCFSGDIAAFYHSIKTLMALPDDTFVYAGHDYVEQSIELAGHIEPESLAIEQYLAGYDPNLVRFTLAQEKAVNPYLRFNEPALVKLMEARGLDTSTEIARWHALMKAF
ncbi:MAG: hydroxyacylglutathione hydrolase C-terminal domain-containing protein [Desulfatibacillaceae bacterium]|nr:hydroxyacylglutathione hydrolase C-terminal domain-containing protein [Desulfatibacillaceae bacterium]